MVRIFGWPGGAPVRSSSPEAASSVVLPPHATTTKPVERASASARFNVFMADLSAPQEAIDDDLVAERGDEDLAVGDRGSGELRERVDLIALEVHLAVPELARDVRGAVRA